MVVDIFHKKTVSLKYSNSTKFTDISFKYREYWASRIWYDKTATGPLVTESVPS